MLFQIWIGRAWLQRLSQQGKPQHNIKPCVPVIVAFIAENINTQIFFT